MKSIEDLFMNSKGRPVVYDGRTIQMDDCLIVREGQILKVKFERVNSDWRQGVCLSTDGIFEVNNLKIEKSIVLWQDSAPTEVELMVHSRNGECRVKNVWDAGDGVMQSWHNGAAMIVEELPTCRLYKCNEGRGDACFDDLIFSIESLW
jgi:hypothetical protein